MKIHHFSKVFLSRILYIIHNTPLQNMGPGSPNPFRIDTCASMVSNILMCSFLVAHSTKLHNHRPDYSHPLTLIQLSSHYLFYYRGYLFT